MALSRGRKGWVGILGLAGMALAVDRTFIFTGGSHANAEDLVIQQEVSHQSAVPERSAGVAHTDLAQRLRAYGAESGTSPEMLPDAFAEPEQWFSAVSASYAQSDGRPVSTSFVLTAVVTSTDGGYAVIDGRLLKVGQTHRGMRLDSIANHNAVIEIGGVRHKLQIAPPTLDR